MISMMNKFMMDFSHKFIISTMININKKWFGFDLYKLVWFGFGSKFSVNDLVSPIFQMLGYKRFSLNGFINFKQIGSVFNYESMVWFGFKAKKPSRNQIRPIANKPIPRRGWAKFHLYDIFIMNLWPMTITTITIVSFNVDPMKSA